MHQQEETDGQERHILLIWLEMETYFEPMKCFGIMVGWHQGNQNQSIGDSVQEKMSAQKVTEPQLR